MNIITVIPLTRAKISPELTYFTASEVPVGAIAEVPLRRKNIHAIVMSVKPAEDMKMDIKNAPFEIRKIGKVKASAFFPSAFIESCKSISDRYATTAGAIMDTLVSDAILDNANKITPPLPTQASFALAGAGESGAGHNLSAVNRSGSERIFAVQGDDADRMSSWRSLIRQEFARKRSIAIYAPTAEDSENIFHQLEKGIEGYIFLLNSGLTKKKVSEIWEKIASNDHPVVIVAVGSFSVLPRNDIDTVVIERENGKGWISQKMPYLDIRIALESIAVRNRQTVFIADSMLRTETLYRLDNDEIDRGTPFKWRSISTARDILVDMRKKDAKPADIDSEVQPKFRVLSPELESLILTNLEENTHLFIMTVRRGLSPMTVCDDCETIVSCRNCSSPVVLHTSQDTGRNFFMCHKCGERRSADENCVNCGGWRLSPLGIGIDRVAEEIRNKFGGVEIFKIDADSTKTEKQIDEILEKFRLKPGSIILGTEIAMLRLSEKIDHIAVASLDSLLALPDFRIQEKIMYTLIRLRAQATRSILVQTRRPEEKIFEYGLKGNLSDFYRSILAERKQFSYPPFSNLIKLTIEGKKDAIAKQMAEIQKLLEPREIDIFPAFTSAVRGNSVIHGLLKIEDHAWPDPEVISILRTLPSGVIVKINPESLL